MEFYDGHSTSILGASVAQGRCWASDGVTPFRTILVEGGVEDIERVGGWAQNRGTPRPLFLLRRGGGSVGWRVGGASKDGAGEGGSTLKGSLLGSVSGGWTAERRVELQENV